MHRYAETPVRQASRLAHLLAAVTGTPERCWFAVWEGWAALAAWTADDAPRLELPNRRMLLLAGPLSAVAAPFTPPPADQSANLWWPEDRSWCVATDIDLMTTYIRGQRRMHRSTRDGSRFRDNAGNSGSARDLG
jgi:hypothetical protein